MGPVKNAPTYTTEAIAAALASVPGVTDLQPGQLTGGGPVVRFQLEGNRAGGVGSFRPGELLVTTGWLVTDGGEPGGNETFWHRSRRVLTPEDIPEALAELDKEVPARPA